MVNEKIVKANEGNQNRDLGPVFIWGPIVQFNEKGLLYYKI